MVASLVIDVVVLTRMRIPAVSVDLPTEVPDDPEPRAESDERDVPPRVFDRVDEYPPARV
ncbi:hypothetical protein [Microbacterium elymi]|uniref:hypothetical protein n=1 Tax=Microbacterium elymi TaxID=2909587 RepID=UPI003F496BE1